jgi:hypothetical protein
MRRRLVTMSAKTAMTTKKYRTDLLRELRGLRDHREVIPSNANRSVVRQEHGRVEVR